MAARGMMSERDTYSMFMTFRASPQSDTSCSSAFGIDHQLAVSAPSDHPSHRLSVVVFSPGVACVTRTRGRDSHVGEFKCSGNTWASLVPPSNLPREWADSIPSLSGPLSPTDLRAKLHLFIFPQPSSRGEQFKIERLLFLLTSPIKPRHLCL